MPAIKQFGSMKDAFRFNALTYRSKDKCIQLGEIIEIDGDFYKYESGDIGRMDFRKICTKEEDKLNNSISAGDILEVNGCAVLFNGFVNGSARFTNIKDFTGYMIPVDWI